MPRAEDLVRFAGLGRFHVMALLQAARYYRLFGDLEKAWSWGLDRAVFYAWAKHYGRERRRALTLRGLEEAARRGGGGGGCPEGMVRVLGECVEVGRGGWFAFGGVEHSPAEFRRRVVERVSRLVPWERAWEAALRYVSRFPEWVLRDPRLFYKYVYEPVRDRFFVELVEGRVPEPPRWVLERLEALEGASRGGGGGSGLDRWLGRGGGEKGEAGG